MAITIGIVTGGQLGKMMIEGFSPLRNGEKILVLDKNLSCPCAPLADTIIQGESKNYDDVLSFGKHCDVIILEFEHVNIQALYALEKMGKKVFCQPKYLEIIQDKGKQKQFFLENNIPSAPFFTIDNIQNFRELGKNISFPVIQKTFLDGYDGGGVQKISSFNEIKDAFDAPSIIEECIDIQREFSLICGRDSFGTIFSYPLVEQFFDARTHIVDCVVSPASVSQKILNQVKDIEEKILSKFSGVGMWAIELFEDENGKILVNEIAPRAHNSGHQTIEGNITSQFSQYMRICLGYPSGSTEITSPSIMYNLLGDENRSGKAIYKGISETLKIPNTTIHLYGKTTTKPHRKMGHITVLGKTSDECWDTIKKVQKQIFVTGE